MRTYRGEIIGDAYVVRVVDGALDLGALPMRHDVRAHATEYAWGGNSQGTRQLALAICLDATESIDRALAVYLVFKSLVVMRLNYREGWMLTRDEALARIASIEQTIAHPVAYTATADEPF